jgi:hypothetical protein
MHLTLCKRQECLDENVLLPGYLPINRYKESSVPSIVSKYPNTVPKFLTYNSESTNLENQKLSFGWKTCPQLS